MEQKRSRGRPSGSGAGKGTPIVVRMQPADLEMLDAVIATHDKPVSRPEAIRQIIKAVFLMIEKETSR